MSSTLTPYQKKGRILSKNQKEQNHFNQFRKHYDVETLFIELQQKKELINSLNEQMQALKTKSANQESQLKIYENAILESEKTKTFTKYIQSGDYEVSLKTQVINLRHQQREKDFQLIKCKDEINDIKKSIKATKFAEQEKTLTYLQYQLQQLMNLIKQKDELISNLKQRNQSNFKKETTHLETDPKIVLTLTKFEQSSQTEKDLHKIENQFKCEQNIKGKRYQSQEILEQPKMENHLLTRKTSETEETVAKSQQLEFFAKKQEINEYNIQEQTNEIKKLKEQNQQLQNQYDQQTQQYNIILSEKEELLTKNILCNKEITELQKQFCELTSNYNILNEKFEMQKINDKLIKILLIHDNCKQGKLVQTKYGYTINQFLLNENLQFEEDISVFIPNKNMRYAKSLWDTHFSDFINQNELEQLTLVIQIQRIQ